MPVYNKASLAKKPKATKKTPLSKRPVKKVPIKQKLPDPPRNPVRSKADSVVTGPVNTTTKKKKTPKPKSRGGR